MSAVALCLSGQAATHVKSAMSCGVWARTWTLGKVTAVEIVACGLLSLERYSGPTDSFGRDGLIDCASKAMACLVRGVSSSRMATMLEMLGETRLYDELLV